ncbi:MAG TPA: clostripain-related cysteine peptidase [Pyrinomonadaceae bacterium]|nr:clostripain-related cysteine peptidase [Pyrinomonadaceae bacterium]
MSTKDNPTPDAGVKTGGGETRWTVIAYLAGDNSLADECVYALTEMKAAETGAQIEIVAQLDPSGRRVETSRFVISGKADESRVVTSLAPAGAALKAGNEVGVVTTAVVTPRGQNGARPRRRRRISDYKLDEVEKGPVEFPRPDGGRTRGVSRAQPDPQDDGETDSGDPATLFHFISWAVANHPADHYMVVLGGHGGGWENEFLRDESPKGGTLTMAELGEVFAAVRSELKTKGGEPLVVDVLGLDSCLMSMAEVCYELRGNVKYMVSTESYGPQSGWPYRTILERMDETIREQGDATPKQVAEIIVDEHVDFYVDYALNNGLSVDISMLDVEKVGDLAEEVKRLAEALGEELIMGTSVKREGRTAAREGRSDFLDQIVLAHWEAQSYNGERFVDLYDFCSRLRERYHPDFVPPAPPNHPSPAAWREREIKAREKVQERCGAIMELIEETFVRRSCNVGVAYQYSFGVSIYFPWAEVSPDYTPDNLKFVGDSGWLDFLKAYVEHTRREPRGFEIDARKFSTLTKSKVRKTPLDGRGRDDLIVQSMRNPPIEVVRGGVSICTRARPETVSLIEDLTEKFTQP